MEIVKQNTVLLVREPFHQNEEIFDIVLSY